jgi:futalosine hydrolase
MNLCIVAAVEQELAVLKRECNVRPEGAIRGIEYQRGAWGPHAISLCGVGVGVVSAALFLGCLIPRLEPDQVLMVGSAGAVPDRGLAVGGVAVASSEALAELGVCEGAGIGTTASVEGLCLAQQLPMDGALAQSLVDAAKANKKIALGPFLTVAGVSSTAEQARERAIRFNAIAENMEGYALALAGRMFRVPVAEVRGMSNMAGDRDKSRWKLHLAALNAQHAILDYLRSIL